MEVKSRKANFTEEEKATLIIEIREREDILRPKLNSRVTFQEKERAWAEIALKLNAANPSVKRSVHEIKKKWHNLTSIMKENLHQDKRAMDRTGAGPSASVLTDLDNQVLSIIGEETPVIAGIKDAPNSLMSTNSSSDMGPNSVDGDSHASTSRLSMKSGFHTAPKRAPKRTADNLYEIYLEKEIERVALSSKKLREEMSKIALEKELIALKIQKLKKEIDCPVKQEVFDLTSWPEM